jgi:AcrR family transcriptional regulator
LKTNYAPQRSPYRDKIIGSARHLFHTLGFRGVGVDTIVEEAGTNKMTLYRHFDSKDDLIVECLREAAAEAEKFWNDIEARHPSDPRAQLTAWINLAAESLASDCRGCDLTNAAIELAGIEHPAQQVIEEVKTAHRNWLAKVCFASGITNADLLADTLNTLLEGARVTRQSFAKQNAGADFTRMATTLVDAFRNSTN